jgi:hypothetical protein
MIVSQIEDPFWISSGSMIFFTRPATACRRRNHRELQRKKVVQTMVQWESMAPPVCLIQPGAKLLAPDYGSSNGHVNNEGREYQYLLYNEIYTASPVSHLIDLGHRRIAYLGNARGGKTTEERERGFREEMRVAGLEVQEANIIMAPESTPLGGYEGAQVLLSLPDMPTAVVCYNDYLAVGVYRALTQAGFRIPQDISVTGFDDINIAAYLNPPLTTLRQFKHDMGVGAAR